MALDDDITCGCPQEIRDFVRGNTDIDVYDYIQRGCNGEVYFGKRKKLGDDVVLKFYFARDHYDSSEEAVILRKIRHANILEIFDLRFIPPSYAFFLTPKISGGDLQGYIDNHSIPTKEALEIIAGILCGTTELHSNHNLVHRDLKPGNILIDIATKRPIIADLGAVRKIANANDYVTASKATRIYLPPESIVDNEYYFQSDIYQIGLILFQLLNGFFPIHNPLEWLTPIEKIKVNQVRNSIERENKFYEMLDDKICKGKLANTSTIPVYLDKEFKKVLNKALHSDYTKRYKSCSEFLKAIHNLLTYYPSYIQTNDCLHVIHNSGKEYKIYSDPNKRCIVERKIRTGGWRRNNDHNGTFDSALLVAKMS